MVASVPRSVAVTVPEHRRSTQAARRRAGILMPLPGATV